MSEHGLPALLTALGLWWSSTGLILYLDGLGRETHRRTLVATSVLAAGALWAVAATAGDTAAGSAYHGFLAGLMVWAWQEVVFLLGYLTGPRPLPCPEGCGLLARARYALAAILWHELAVLVAAAALLVLTWGQPNQLALWTYLLLWGMRSSAKLNLFLGVRNLYAEFLPAHLRFLASYFRQRPMNLLFPVSVSAATAVSILLLQRATDPAAQGFQAAGAWLLATLSVLGLLEHWFLVLPLPVERLWGWGLASHRRAAKPLPPITTVPRVQEAT